MFVSYKKNQYEFDSQQSQIIIETITPVVNAIKYVFMWSRNLFRNIYLVFDGST